MSEEKKYDAGQNGVAEAHENTKRRPTDFNPDKLAAAFENPLSGISKEQLMSDVETFCKEHNLTDHLEDFKKGALVAQRPSDFQSFTELSEEDRVCLEREHTHRWSQPWQLYWLCSKSNSPLFRCWSAYKTPSYVLIGSRRPRNG